MEQLSSNSCNLPGNAVTYVIDGGNYSQFGNYGSQSGDGEASVSAEQQQSQSAELITEFIKGPSEG